MKQLQLSENLKPNQCNIELHKSNGFKRTMLKIQDLKSSNEF